MAEFWQTLDGPPIAQGEDADIDLAGTVDPSGWTLAVTVSATAKGPPLAGITPTASTPGGNAIRVTLTAAQSVALAVGPKFVVVRRTDTGNARALANFKIEIYDPSYA